MIANPTQTALSTKERVLVYLNGESSRNVVFRYSLIQGFPLSPGHSSISLLLQFCLPLLVFSVLEQLPTWQEHGPRIHTPSSRERENRLLLQQGALRVTLIGKTEISCPLLAIPMSSGIITTDNYQSSSSTELQAWFFHWLPINGDYIILLYNPIA